MGILINDSTGKNTYIGKTGSQGAGHLGGVGILDVAGPSTFTAIHESS